MSSRVLFVLALATAAAAQCDKPAIPAGGLALRTIPDVLVTYGDGTRTRGELLLPQQSPPSCGWPLIVWVHPLGSSRTSYQPERQLLASRGFAVWSYDVRGQGDHAVLNPNSGALIDGGPEHADLGEQIRFVQSNWSGTVGTRTGVAGSSQGGAHAWAAAAFSGRRIDIPGRPAVQFPRIDAAAAADLVPEPILFRVKDRKQFQYAFVDLLLSTAYGLKLHKSQFDLLLNTFLDQDPERMAHELETEPGRAVLPLLRSTSVPILHSHSWLDGVVSPRQVLEVLPLLPATTPRRLVLHTTGIHSAPINDAEIKLQQELRLRWFDRFLWNVADPVETEAPILAALIPTDPTVLADHTSLWPRRQLAAWPQPNVTLHLHGTGRLDPQPSPASPPLFIDHQFPSLVIPQNYLIYAGLRTKDMILRYSPVAEVSYRSQPLATESELLGSPKVSLTVMSGSTRFSVSAALYARLPNRSDAWMLASESTSVLAAEPGQPRRVEFELTPAGSLLPAGTVLELVLRNHWLTSAPYQDAIVMVPEFTSGKLGILHEAPPQQSFLHLPLRPVDAGLTSNVLGMPAVAPVPVPLQVDAGASRRGVDFVMLGGASGHVPVGLIPSLKVDALTYALLGLGNSALTQNFIGKLGPDGYASAQFAAQLAAPLPPQLIGSRLTFGALILDPGGLLATNPVDVVIR